MLSRSSFKAELIEYRSNLKPPLKPGDRGPLGIGNRNSADLQLLDRWIDNPRADDIWRKLKKHNPEIDPAAFIKTVLAARRSAQASVNREYGADITRGLRCPKRALGVPYRERAPGFNEASGHALQEIKEVMELMPAALPSTLLEAADFLEGAADFFEEHAQYIRSLHESRPERHSDHLGLPGGSKFKLSRKDQGGTRVRRLFERIMGDWFSKQCGRPLLEVTALLTEIAFPGKDVDRDNVADARKIRTKSK